MPVSLPVAFLFLAQAAAAPAGSSGYGPVAAVPPPPTPPPSDPTQRECTPQNKDPNANAIVVCAVKPEGYRLPPDIVEARRLKKEGITGGPRNPHESFADHSCANVGPMGCRGTPTVDLVAVAATVAKISQRLAKGQEVGSVFQTEKASSDYQLYQMAKQEREAKEAAAAGRAAKAKAVAIKAASPQPATPPAATPQQSN